MFELHDKVFYGVIGVCEIVNIGNPPIKGVEGEYYFLQPVFDDKGIIYSPLKSTKQMMRKIITKQEGTKIVEAAKNCIKDESLSKAISTPEYDDIIKSQVSFDILHLIRYLYIVKNERAKDLRKMKSADSRILLIARKLLYGELAIVLNRDYDDICSMMDEYLGR